MVQRKIPYILAASFLTASGISLMPEGLEQGLDRQKLADLIAFLQQRPHTNEPSSPWWRFW